MNTLEQIRNQLLTRTGVINSAILRRDWFKESDLYRNILNETAWMDEIDPTIGQRAKAILFGATKIEYCTCGKPCGLDPRNNVLFRKTCEDRRCVILASQYIRTDDIREKMSKTKKQNRNHRISKFLSNFDKSLTPVSDESVKTFIQDKWLSDANKALVTPIDYDINKNILYSILLKTPHISIAKDDLCWSRRMYDIMNGISTQKQCKCGCPVGYNNRVVGYSTLCPKCALDIIPTIRIENNCKKIAEVLSEEYAIEFGGAINVGKMILTHRSCGTTFTRWGKNGRWQTIKCPKCHAHISNIEKLIRDYISNFTTVEKISLENREIDIYSKMHNIGIEVNGLYWHSEEHGKGRNYHLNKTNIANKHGIRLIHIYEDEIYNNLPVVFSRIKAIFKQTKYRLYGRNCIVKPISSKEKTKFLNKYHIQGDDKSSIKLGAFYKNRLVAVMTFGNRRFDKKMGHELIRYATISSFNCVGVAGKLLKYFEKHYSPSSIVSYADKRWSDGNLYKKLGFTHIHDSPPNYFYINDGNRESRLKYQKHKLKNILPIYDETLSESQNMKNNGFLKIWDCGNMVFEKKYPQ